MQASAKRASNVAFNFLDIYTATGANTTCFDYKFRKVDMEREYFMKDFSAHEIEGMVEEELMTNWDRTLDWMVLKIGLDPKIKEERDYALSEIYNKTMGVITDTYNPSVYLCLTHSIDLGTFYKCMGEANLDD